jgi:hypothetical protein
MKPFENIFEMYPKYGVKSPDIQADKKENDEEEKIIELPNTHQDK